MATVRAYSVCQSDVEAGQNRRSATVYSYSPSVGLQDGSALTPDGTPAEDAYRTGLSQAYCHGGAATADADADGFSAAYLRSCRNQYCGAGVLLLSRDRRKPALLT